MAIVLAGMLERDRRSRALPGRQPVRASPVTTGGAVAQAHLLAEGIGLRKRCGRERRVRPALGETEGMQRTGELRPQLALPREGAGFFQPSG